MGNLLNEFLDTTRMITQELVRLYDIAVSYTHLRAHETVLDIVCRLLLEQKTQN